VELISTPRYEGPDCAFDIATRYGWTVWRSNPGGGEIFRTRPAGRGAHPASYTMGTGSFPVVKRPDRGVDLTPPSNAEVEGRVELYICSPSGLSWLVLG
jgi:hypothetical protein